MKLIIPEEVLRERLLPYAATLDSICVIHDTIYQIATMTIEKCLEKDNWNDPFIEEHANNYTWEAIGETAEEIFNFDESKDNYEQVCKNIAICSGAVFQIVKQLIQCLNIIPEEKFKHFRNKDTLIQSDITDDENVIIDIEHYIPH